MQNKAGKDWPLTRPLELREWSHLLKAIIVRRVAPNHPIARDDLLRFAAADIEEATGIVPLVEKISIVKGSYGMYKAEEILPSLLSKKMLRLGTMVTGQQGVYRTPETEMFEEFLPETIRAVLKIVPYSFLADMLAYEADVDAD